MVTTIPHDQQSVDWMKYLSIHEYRHVAQVESINRSTTGFLSKVLGQHVTGAVAGVHLPLWFLEGDAVLTETLLSRSGRGRLPSFYFPLIAQVLEKGNYSYDKASMGSYRDIVPNHYILGYHLAAVTQNIFGFQPFIEATKQVSKTPILPRSFTMGIKRSSGLNVSELYELAIDHLTMEWDSILSDFSDPGFLTLGSAKNSDYVNYQNPHYINDSQFIAFRIMPADIPRLIKLDRQGNEKVLFTPGFGFYETLSYGNGMAVWAEIKRDPRWAYRAWTNIRVLDLNNGNNWLITKKGRFQSPRLSPDASKIAVIEIDETNNWDLVVFSTITGKVLFRFSDPEIGFLMEPAWDDNGSHIIAIAFTEGSGKGLVRTSLQNPGFEVMLNVGDADIFDPYVRGESVYFTGTWSGRDEIYALNMTNGEVSHLPATKYGSSSPVISADGKKVLFSVLTATGHNIAEAGTNKMQDIEIPSVRSDAFNLFASGSKAENFQIGNVSLKDLEHESKPFNKFFNHLHFHSWLPAALDVNQLNALPGISFLSQDLLGTTTFSAGYVYENEVKGHKGFIDYSIQAWYPEVSLRIETGAEDRNYYDRERDTVITIRTNLMNAIAGISLPLSFNNNATVFGFIPRISTTQEFYSFDFAGQTYKRGRRPVSYSISTYAYRRMAFRDLYPRFGISGIAGFRHTPFRSIKSFTDVDAGNIVYSAASVFLPGIARHHSLRLYIGWQNKNYGQTYFGDAIRFARGYEPRANEELALVSVNYALPLIYPDKALGSLIYAKRLRANVFVDYSFSTYRGILTELATYGIDLLMDAHLLRMPMPFEFGVRAMYLEGRAEVAFEFLWGVDFYALGRMLNLRNPVLRPGY